MDVPRQWMYNHILLLMSQISPSIHHQISPIKADAFDLVHTINLPKTINKSEVKTHHPRQYIRIKNQSK